MASVFQHIRRRKLKDGSVRTRKVWAIEWRENDGRLRREDTDYDTKAQARLAAREIEKRLENERRGVEVGLDETVNKTLAELVRWWLEKVDARSPSHSSNRTTIEKNLLGTAQLEPGKPVYKPHPLSRFRLRDLTTGQVNNWLDERERQEELAPGSVNHLRMFIIRAWTAAQDRDELTKKLPCPALEAKRRKVPKRLPSFLEAHEVPPMLRWVAEQWRDLFATAVYTAMRKGELAGLLKTNVHLQLRILFARNSYERDVTKGGDEDAIPIHPELVPYLDHAMAVSQGDHVFEVLRPVWSKGGKKEIRHALTRDTKLDRILKSALRRAGIVTGYIHKCRRKGCGHKSERVPDDGDRWCPRPTVGKDGKPSTCGFKLQAVGIPKPVRFHDLRHTTATLLLQAGVELSVVSRILRHSDERITRDIYAHLQPKWLQDRISRVSFAGPRLLPTDSAPGTDAAGESDEPTKKAAAKKLEPSRE